MGKKVTQKKEFPIFTTFCIVIGILLAVAISLTVYNGSGAKYRGQILVQVGDTTVNALDFGFQYQSAVNNSYYNYLQMFAQYYGVTNFSDKCAFNASQTWADYAASLARNSVNSDIEGLIDEVKGQVCMYKEALAGGMTLSEEHSKAIEDYVNSVRASATQNNMTLNDYMSAYYGQGFKEDDLRKMLTISYFAEQYAEELVDGYEFDDTAREKFYNDNRTKFDKYTYNVYKIDCAKATSSAAESSAAETSSAAEKPTRQQALADAAALKERLIKGESFAEVTNDTEGKTRREDYAYSSIVDGSVVTTWLTAAERKEGDVAVLEADEAVYLVKFEKAARDEYRLITVNMAEAKAVSSTAAEIGSEAAEEAQKTAFAALKTDLEAKLGEWQNNGGSLEGFVELAKSVDKNLNEDGRIENMIKGYFGGELDDWAFSDDRKEGDYNFFANDAENGYNLIYYVSQNEFYWKKLADSGLTDEKYEADYNALVEKYASDTTVDSAAAEKLFG